MKGRGEFLSFFLLFFREWDRWRETASNRCQSDETERTKSTDDGRARFTSQSGLSCYGSQAEVRFLIFLLLPRARVLF